MVKIIWRVVAYLIIGTVGPSFLFYLGLQVHTHFNNHVAVYLGEMITLVSAVCLFLITMFVCLPNYIAKQTIIKLKKENDEN